MAADPEYLRKHYASLSDDALEAIDRDDLVETARKCYDEELRQRGWAQSREVAPDAPDDEAGVDSDHFADDQDWLEDAAEVFSCIVKPGAEPTADAVDARDALEAAGIPCSLDVVEIPAEKTSPEPVHQWRLLVPGELNLRASSVLERDIANPKFETYWQAHLSTLSDGELRAMSPRVVFCGLFDKVERVNKIYEEETARRRLKAESA